MDLEVMLNEVSQRRTNNLWFLLYVESKTQNKWTNKTSKLIHRRKLVIITGGKGWEDGRKTVKGIKKYKLPAIIKNYIDLQFNYI